MKGGREWEGMMGGRRRSKMREAERDSGRRENVGGWREGVWERMSALMEKA